MTALRLCRFLGAVPLALFVLAQAAAPAVSTTGEGGGSARALVKGPYLQNLSAGNVTICWETDAPSNATVFYGKDGSAELSVSDGNLTTFHELRLVGLSANTAYRYRAVSGDTPGAPSTFTTAPSGSTPFRFAVYGDCRTGHQNHTNIIAAMRSQGPAFVLNTGDLVENGSSAADWETFFGIISPIANNTPYWPCPGNHDLPPDLYTKYFSLPGNEMYYSFDCGGAHFISLDSAGDLTDGSAQLEWLEADLEASAARDWKFVFLHYPLYSSALGHGSNLALRALLDPLFVRHGVSAVFAGHDHDYEHADPGNGVQYFVTGGGGAPLGPSGKAGFTVYSESAFHYIIVDVGEDPHHTKVTAIRENGTVMETVHLSNVPRPPAPPSGLSVTNSTHSSLTVSWQPPKDPYLVGYNIAVSNNGSIMQEEFTGPVAGYAFHDLPADTSFTVTARALYRDPLGTPPDYTSAPVNVSGRTAPAAEEPLSVRIVFPVAGTRVYENNSIFCRAEASGHGNAEALSVEWRLDGALLAGNDLNMSLRAGPVGDHTLAVRVSDGMGRSNGSSVGFTVAPWHGGDPFPGADRPYTDPPVTPFLAAAAAFVIIGVLAAYVLAKRSEGKRPD
jgi:hypothetical protein